MSNKFEKVIDNLFDNEDLIIGDKTYSNETISDQYLQGSMLGTIKFYNINFNQVDFSVSAFINCCFKDCIFNEVTFQKCEFWNPTFENCKINKSDWTKATFHKSIFRDCLFIDSDLTTSTVSESEFISTKFQNTNLKQITAWSVKIWKSDQYVEINDPLEFENLLINTNYKDDI